MPTPAADVAHLLRRAGFGGTPARIAELGALDRVDLVDAVLSTTGAPADDPPAAIADPAVDQYPKWVAATQWWLDRMATSPTPIVEKMTLFWHGHFVSGQGKVFDMDWMVRQNRLYRSLALGSFPTLTQKMAIEPAMLDYLDNRRNRAGQPNQNFARELMELFTIGVGNYTEADVDAAAKAWTGHRINDTTRQYELYAPWHDTTQKTFMGVTKNWDGPDIIDHLLTNATTRALAARFVARKLWLFLVGPEPSSATLTTIATAFASQLDIRALLRAIFLHDDFWTTTARQGLVRSPIEFAVGVMRATGLAGVDANPQWWLGSMGQEPFDPPNVSGWRTNGYWISTSAASARAGFVRYVTWRARDRGVLASTLSATPTVAVQQAFDTFAVDRASARTRSVLEAWVSAQRSAGQSWAVQPNLLTLVPLTPEFQLA
ncbi:MAG: DUF1800 domain-containing protein [Acidimicrobiales bacterium]|jgi:uncharacterized protein (DUF1800 family)|nr:DUF1800 domain-containing protein [Acidimicrobiales bacterium]